jgi:hypothetical protein
MLHNEHCALCGILLVAPRRSQARHEERLYGIRISIERRVTPRLARERGLQWRAVFKVETGVSRTLLGVI